MKTLTSIIVSALLIFLIPFCSSAQNDSAIQTKFSHFRMGTLYNSHINYYGRTDSMHSSALIPVVELWMNKNFYASATPVFIHNKIQKLQYNGTVATLGYQFNNEKGFAGQIYFVKPFFKTSSKIVQSAIKAQTGANFTWLNDYINISAGGDIKFSDKNDLGMNSGIDHLIRIPIKKSSLIIDPAVYLYAGTQRFTQTYLSKKQSFLLIPQNEIINKQTESFDVIAYEFSVPAILTIQNFLQLIVSPAYIIPKNDPTSSKGLMYLNTGMKVLL